LSLEFDCKDRQEVQTCRKDLRWKKKELRAQYFAAIEITHLTRLYVRCPTDASPLQAHPVSRLPDFRYDGTPARYRFHAQSASLKPQTGRCMYHYQTAYWPQSNPYFAAFKRPAMWSESSSLSKDEDPPAKPGGAARTDTQIEQDVRDELEMESSVRAGAISIQVKDGVVTLNGIVDGDGERWLIESAARRIAGVRDVSGQLKSFAPDITPADDDIALDCERVLGRLTPKTDYAIGVLVSNGWVTLSGNVAEGYERWIAETEVADLLSVHGINSQVKVRSSIARADATARAAASGSVQHDLKSGDDEFEADNDRLTWSNAVHSWAQHRDMLYAAWSSLRAKRVIAGIRPT
jgi:osmotically-inducible protein OsmY